jgi:DNA-binding response OmpR family regulator
MTVSAPRILCVEPDPRLLDTRCTILMHKGYNVYPASLPLAEVLLASQTIDLIILSSRLGGEERRQIAIVAGNTEIMVLEGLTMPSELLSEVAKLLHHGQERTA